LAKIKIKTDNFLAEFIFSCSDDKTTKTEGLV